MRHSSYAPLPQSSAACFDRHRIISATTRGRVQGHFRRERKRDVDHTHDMSERVAFLVPVAIDDTGNAGEKDKAFELLERAYSQRDSGLTSTKLSPALDSLRADPRYRALLRKMKLPE